MNIRVWGGWLLVALGITVLMTMGCEKGALGVRSSTVMGTIVDSASSNPVSGVRVKLVSESAVSGNTQLALGQNYVTLTDVNGRFAFTNMNPDKMKLEASKVGYEDLEYPGASSTVTTLYVPNGENVEVGSLKMVAIPNPLPQNISVRITLRDSKSMEILDGNTVGPVSISFDDKVYTYTVTEWKNGKTTAGVDITLPAKSGSYAVAVNPNPDYYKTTSVSLSGSSSIMTDITLEANSYNLIIRCVNVPDYIQGGVVNIYAEKAGTNPPKVLATHTISNLGTLTSPNLPEIVNVPGIAFPINLRVNVRGYEDEVVSITNPIIAAGEQGNIRLDVDFLLGNAATTFTLNTTDKTKACLLDNRKSRRVILRVAGVDLLDGDTVAGVLWGTPQYQTGNPVGPLFLDPVPAEDGYVDVVFDSVPVGYKLPWLVTVMPAGARAASGSYSLDSGNAPPMINPPDDSPAPTLLLGVAAKRPG